MPATSRPPVSAAPSLKAFPTVKSSQVKSSQVKSFQFNYFSSVQFNGVPHRPDHLRRKRSERICAAQLAWLDERCWHGLVIPRAARERARGRASEFWRYGVLARQGPSRRRWRLAQRRQGRSRAFTECAPHPARTAARTISRMRVRATHRRLQHAMGAAAEVLAQDAEREQQREAGRRRRGQQQQRGRTSARRTTSSDRWRSKVHGAGPRCRRVRYCPLGCESGPECARAC